MEVLVYSKTSRGKAERLICAIAGVVPDWVIHACHTVQSLSLRLCQPGPPPEVIVLLAVSRKDLSEILSIQGLLTDLRLILLLPDKRQDTISKGHTLYPRFLSYADGNFVDVAAVLKRMITNGGHSRKARRDEERGLSEVVWVEESAVIH